MTHTAKETAPGRPYYEGQTWVERLFRVRPKHDCRSHLPPADTLPEGVVMACPACGEWRKRVNYCDDDPYGGTGEYCAWWPARPSVILPGSPDA